MKKILKIIFILFCIILILGCISIKIIVLKNEIKKQEQNNEVLSKEIENLKSLSKNEIDLKEDLIKENFSWIEDYNWNKVTLTNSSGTTIDITESDIIKYHFLNTNILNTFKFDYNINSQISKSYKYVFYFNDFSKEITLSNGGFVHEALMCKNIYLYNVAEALLPLQDDLDNVKKILLNSKFFSYKQKNEFDFVVPYLQMRYIILEWMPKHTVKIENYPNLKDPTINIECYYYGEKAYFKTYTYNNIQNYYIELTYKENRNLYKLININNESMTLFNILNSSIE